MHIFFTILDGLRRTFWTHYFIQLTAQNFELYVPICYNMQLTAGIWRTKINCDIITSLLTLDNPKECHLFYITISQSQIYASFMHNNIISESRNLGNSTVFMISQHMRFVWKVLRQKLYLPWQKWTLDETLVFLRTLDATKKYQDWRCIP